MRSSVFGELERENEYGWWEGQVRLAFFAAYDTVASDVVNERYKRGAGPPAAVPQEPDAENDRPRDQEDEFDLVVEDAAGNGPSQAQERALLYLKENEESVCQAVLNSVFDLYARYVEDWRDEVSHRFEPEDLDELLPVLDSPEGLKRLLRLDSVHVHEFAKDGCAVLQFSFSCAWDDEHGLAVAAHKDTILGVGDAGEGLYDGGEEAEDK